MPCGGSWVRHFGSKSSFIAKSAYYLHNPSSPPPPPHSLSMLADKITGYATALLDTAKEGTQGET